MFSHASVILSTEGGCIHLGYIGEGGGRVSRGRGEGVHPWGVHPVGA